jgi:NDP-sugar pyrophosphorylase family protein
MDASLDLLILCAGRGERLRPLTDVCPKPLLPLAGVAMADRALAACEPLSPVRRLANAHHLPDQILSWAEARRIDHVQVEPVLLDTGGAIGRLESEGQLLSEHILVHNGDLVHDIDLCRAWAQHLRSGASATLVVVDRPRINTVVADPDGRFAGVLGHERGPALVAPGHRARTFSGIAFYRRRAFCRRPEGPWSVKELWHDLLEKNDPIHVWEAPPDALWDDLGTGPDLSRAVREELARRGLDR